MAACSRNAANTYHARLPCVAGTATLLQDQSIQRQAEWLCLLVLVVIVEQVFISNLQVLEKKWLIPDLLLHTFDWLQVHASFMLSSPHCTSTTISWWSVCQMVQKKPCFPFASYAYMSTHAVEMCSQLMVADIILSATQSLTAPQCFVSKQWPRGPSLWQRLVSYKKSMYGDHDSLVGLLYSTIAASYSVSYCPVSLQLLLLLRYVAFVSVVYSCAKFITWCSWNVTCPASCRHSGNGLLSISCTSTIESK